MTSQNDSFIKTQNHRQEQPRDTHSLTSQSSQRIQVVARTPTTKWQAQLTAHSFSHGIDWKGCHIASKAWIKSRCFLTTKCLAPEGKSHTHRKQSLPKPGNSLHLGPILKTSFKWSPRFLRDATLAGYTKHIEIQDSTKTYQNNMRVIENPFKADLSQARFPGRHKACLRQLKHPQMHRHPPCRSGSTRASNWNNNTVVKKRIIVC